MNTSPSWSWSPATELLAMPLLGLVLICAAVTLYSCDPESLRREIAGLRRAMETRPSIDQARGMVMALARCGPAQAWEVLQEVSQRTNIKLHVVAEQLLATRAGQPLPTATRRALGSALKRRRGPQP